MIKSFGDRLIYYMYYRDMPAWRLSTLTGIPFEDIEHYMLNDKKPDATTRQKLADALNTKDI